MKVFFFDIDGTILYNQKVSNRVKEAIRNIRSEGNLCFIASGRPYSFILDSIKEIEFDGYILANGACVLYNDKIISEEVMDYSQLKELLEFLKKHGNEYALDSKYYCYLHKEFKRFYQFFKDIEVNVNDFIYEFDEEEVLKKTIKVEVFPKNKQASEIIKTQLTQFSWNEYDSTNMELYSKDVSKATGITKLIQYLNIPITNTYCFGDGRNDIEMFEAVENSYAMGNAVEELKAKAKYICPSVEEDGVAVVLESLLK